jgi:hypothetical protein
LVHTSNETSCLLQCFDFDGNELATLKLPKSAGGTGSSRKLITSICGCFDDSCTSVRFSVGLVDGSVRILEWSGNKLTFLSSSIAEISSVVASSESGGGGNSSAVGVLGQCFTSKDCIAAIRLESEGILSLRLIDIDGAGNGAWREHDEGRENKGSFVLYLFFIIFICNPFLLLLPLLLLPLTFCIFFYVLYHICYWGGGGYLFLKKGLSLQV